MGFFTRQKPDIYGNRVRWGVVWTCIIGVVIALVWGLIALFTSLHSVPQSEVGFQVGGGMFDGSKNKVKSDLLGPGLHVTGTLDHMWTYPSYKTVRFQDFEVTVTTLDGKKVDIQGQLGFRFVGEHNPALAKQFAEGVGARKYGGERPGESNKGWENFLDQLVSPEIYAAFKDQIGRVYCADFEPACRAIDPRTDVPQADPERVWADVSSGIQSRIDTKLGDPYLQGALVRVKRITLPPEVQANIDQVTAEQARTKAAQQSEQTAKAEAEAIRVKGAALRENRDVIALEVAKQCRGGDRCTIILDSSAGVSATVPTGR